jgi:hypothetical protein
MQSVLDAADSAGGAIVFVPKGTFLISGSLAIGDNTVLMGLGFSSIIKLADGSNCNMLINKGFSIPSSNESIVVTNVKLNGNWQNQSAGDCIDFHATSKLRIIYCQIVNAYHDGITIAGYDIQAGNDIEIAHNTISGCRRTGILHTGGTHVRIHHNDVNHSGSQYAIHVEPNNEAYDDINDTIISENHLVVSGGYGGIVVSASGFSIDKTQIIIDKNTITGDVASNYGIRVSGLSGIGITENHITAMEYAGIFLSGDVDHSVVLGNVIWNIGDSDYGYSVGIWLKGSACTENLLEGNVVWNVGVGTRTKYGIWLDENPINCIVVGNKLKNMGTISISESGEGHHIADNSTDAATELHQGFKARSTLVFDSEVGIMIGNEVFGPTDGNVFIKDPGGSDRNFDPSGTFATATLVILVNTADGPETITFDSSGISQGVGQNECGIFVYGGSNWEVVWLGHNDLTQHASPQFAGLMLTGDISGAGGFKQPFSFMQSDVAKNQTGVAIDVLGLSGSTEVVMPYAGSVIGISIASNEARSGGTLTVDAAVNGLATGLQAQLGETYAQYHSATQAKDTNAFSAGDRLGVKITTDNSWTPTTADIVVVVIVEM